MKKIYLSLIVLVAILISAFAFKSTPENSVDGVVALFVKSVNDKNLEPLNAVFSAKAKIYEQGSVDESWEKYRDGHLGKEIEAMENMKFSIDVKESLESGQMALVRGNYNIQGDMHGNVINSSGLVTMSMMQESGTWKVVHLQFSRGCK